MHLNASSLLSRKIPDAFAAVSFAYSQTSSVVLLFEKSVGTVRAPWCVNVFAVIISWPDSGAPLRASPKERRNLQQHAKLKWKNANTKQVYSPTRASQCRIKKSWRKNKQCERTSTAENNTTHAKSFEIKSTGLGGQLINKKWTTFIAKIQDQTIHSADCSFIHNVKGMLMSRVFAICSM